MLSEKIMGFLETIQNSLSINKGNLVYAIANNYNYSCQDTCYGSCVGDCAGSCSGSCSSDCSGSCEGRCDDTCSADGYGTCELTR